MDKTSAGMYRNKTDVEDETDTHTEISGVLDNGADSNIGDNNIGRDQYGEEEDDSWELLVRQWEHEIEVEEVRVGLHGLVIGEVGVQHEVGTDRSDEGNNREHREQRAVMRGAVGRATGEVAQIDTQTEEDREWKKRIDETRSDEGQELLIKIMRGYYNRKNERKTMYYENKRMFNSLSERKADRVEAAWLWRIATKARGVGIGNIEQELEMGTIKEEEEEEHEELWEEWEEGGGWEEALVELGWGERPQEESLGQPGTATAIERSITAAVGGGERLNSRREEDFSEEWEDGGEWEQCLQESLELELLKGNVQTDPGVYKRGDRAAATSTALKSPPLLERARNNTPEWNREGEIRGDQVAEGVTAPKSLPLLKGTRTGTTPGVYKRGDQAAAEKHALKSQPLLKENTSTSAPRQHERGDQAATEKLAPKSLPLLKRNDPNSGPGVDRGGDKAAEVKPAPKSLPLPIPLQKRKVEHTPGVYKRGDQAAGEKTAPKSLPPKFKEIHSTSLAGAPAEPPGPQRSRKSPKFPKKTLGHIYGAGGESSHIPVKPGMDVSRVRRDIREDVAKLRVRKPANNETSPNTLPEEKTNTGRGSSLGSQYWRCLEKPPTTRAPTHLQEGREKAGGSETRRGRKRSRSDLETEQPANIRRPECHRDPDRE